MAIKVFGVTIGKTLKKEYLLNKEEFLKHGTESERIDYAWNVYNSKLSKYTNAHKNAAISYLKDVYNSDDIEFISKMMDGKIAPMNTQASPSKTPQAMLIDSFNAGKVNDVVDSFKQLNKEITNYLPEMGPLPKLSYTYQYELLVRKFLAKEVFVCVSDKENNQIVTFMDGSQFNVTEIITHANLDHLEFNSVDLINYENYCEQSSIVKPADKYGEYPSEQYFQDADTEGLFKDVSYGEKLAINLYTTNYYNEINPLLRGYYPFSNKEPQQIRDVLVHNALCGFALSKTKAVNIDGAFRYEDIYSKEVLDNRIKISEQGGAEVVRGFISSGIKPAQVFESKVAITYTNLKGKYIAPLSHFPDEMEFLIPPTQMTYEGHYEENGTHYFQARPVVDLAKIDQKAQKLATPSEQNTYKIKELLTNLSTMNTLIKDNTPQNYKIHKVELDKIEEWAREELANLNDAVSPEALHLKLGEMWSKLSDLSQHVHTETAARLHGHFEKRVQAERSTAAEHLEVGCNEVSSKINGINTSNDPEILSYLKHCKDQINLLKKSNNVEGLIALQAEMQGKYFNLLEPKLNLEKNKYHEFLKELEQYKIGHNDKKIDLIIAKKTQEINAINSEDKIKTMKQELEITLADIKKEMIEHENQSIVQLIHDDIQLLLKNINTYRFGKHDKQMDIFLEQKKQALNDALSTGNVEELSQIKINLKSTLNTLSKDQTSAELRTLIESYRNKIGFGTNAKADRIEKTITNIPLHDRIHIEQRLTTEAKEVFEAISSHRLFNRGNVNEQEGVDKFVSFKAKLQKMKSSSDSVDNQSQVEESHDSSMVFKK